MRAKDFRKQALAALRGQWGAAIAVSLLATLMTAGVAESGFTGFEETSGMSAIVAAQITLLVSMSMMLYSAVSFVISGAVEFGYSLFHLNLIDGKRARFVDLFALFNRLGAGIVMVLWRMLFLFLWMLPSIGTILIGTLVAYFTVDISGPDEIVMLQIMLIVIPYTLVGMIPAMIAMYRYALMPYLMVEFPRMSAPEAMRISKRLMYGSKWRMFCLEMSFFGWNVLSVLTMGIGYLWLTPYMATAQAAFYRRILNEWRTENLPPPPQIPAPEYQENETEKEHPYDSRSCLE